MTTLVTADLHLSDNPRDAYRLVFYEQTLPVLLREYEATRLLVLGDLTESKDAHRAGLVNCIVDGTQALAEEVDVYFLEGNHDRITDVAFFRHMQHLDRVRWISEPTRLKLRGLGGCLLLPHTRDLDDWVDHMLDEFDWCFCHQTFGGANLGHGHRAEGGAPPFTRGARVVSGDVHTPQKLGPVTYVGAPYTVDFGDDYTPRVLVLDGEETRSVPVYGPQKRLLDLARLEDLEGTDASPGDVVKLRVTLPSGFEGSRAELRADAHRWAEDAGVVLHAVQFVEPEGKRERIPARDRPRRSDEELIRAYAKKMGKGKATIAAGLKLMEKAQ